MPTLNCQSLNGISCGVLFTTILGMLNGRGCSAASAMLKQGEVKEEKVLNLPLHFPLLCEPANCSAVAVPLC